MENKKTKLLILATLAKLELLRRDRELKLDIILSAMEFPNEVVKARIERTINGGA